MNQYQFFALAAVVFATARYVTYFHSIYKGETKPHAFSWLLWGIVTGIGAFAQFDLNGGPSAWALTFVSVTCLFIAALSFVIGDRDYKKSDWLALIISLLAIPLWRMTDNPVLALFTIMFVDLLTYWPTVRKSFNKPLSEPPISYFLAGVRYFLMLFAVPEATWQTLMYPFFLMLSDWGFALYIVVRRVQLGLPWHEYKSSALEKIEDGK